MNQIPKVTLGIYPTPLQEISAKVAWCNENIRLFLKRDDLCGIGFGGNKVRKLEYILADALANGADSIVTGGGSQSNQISAVAVCAAKLGLSAHLVIPESTGAITRGIAALSGAVTYETESGQTNVLMKKIRSVAYDLMSQGHTPYIVAPGASTPLGALGYVDAMEEMCAQAEEKGIVLNHVICCGATGNTYAGITLGAKLFSAQTRCTAIAIGRRFTHNETLLKQIHQAEILLGCDSHIAEDDLHVHFSCGKGASEPSIKGKEAMHLMASSYGILLDPYFTGKAFAGFLELCEEGAFCSGDNIAFIHTGGMASLLNQLK